LLYINTNYQLMNFYQQKWIDTLTDIKLIRDNIPSTIAAMSLDIEEAKQRLKFIFHNGHEQFEYLLNPVGEDLNGE